MAKLSKGSDAKLWVCRREPSRIARLPAHTPLVDSPFSFVEQDPGL